MAAARVACRGVRTAVGLMNSQVREMSGLVKLSVDGRQAFIVDTLCMVRKLEGEGISSNQAEAITAAIREVLNDGLEKVSNTFVSSERMRMSEMAQDANLSKFKSEVQRLQERHFSLLQHETEKLKVDVDKMRGELRYEIDKVTATQRLELNIERGQLRDDLTKKCSETANLTNKLDGEIHGLRAKLEAAKYEVIKYCVGTLVSISAVSLAFFRLLK